MIQRVQTLFLVGAIVLQIALFFMPFWKGNATVDFNGQPKSEVASLSVHSLTENYKGQIDAMGDAKALYILQGFNAFILLFSGSCIFMFNNRKRQLRFSRYLIALAIVLIVGLLYFAEQAKTAFADDASNLQKIGANFQLAANTYDIGIYLPIVSIICFFFAGRYIQKDEKLVRSADRLR